MVRDVAALLAGRSVVTDAALLAQQPNNFGDTRSGSLAGPIGLFIILLLAVATVLLIRNMNSRLRRLPDRFPPPPAEDADADHGRGRRPDSTSEGP